uniref:SCAN box domain-containing protein n=1 Tax=Pelusios castaneus TaxID=367368 RepID=A0A8C8RPM3_9SAUR
AAGDGSGVLLAGVQAAYMALSEAQAKDYEAIRAAVLDRMGLPAEKYRQTFRAARWTGSLWPRTFAQRLMDWGIQWLRPDTHTVDEIMDMLVLEQFIHSLPETLRVWVRRHQPTSIPLTGPYLSLSSMFLSIP